MDLAAEVGGEWELASPDLAIKNPGSGFLVFGGVDKTEVWGVAGGEFNG